MKTDAAAPRRTPPASDHAATALQVIDPNDLRGYLFLSRLAEWLADVALTATTADETADEAA